MIDLSRTDLCNAHLYQAHLEGALLLETCLEGANLREANLQQAKLRWARLGKANLWGANLHSADLRNAIGLTSEDLEIANGNAQTMLPKGLKPPDWWKTTKTGNLIPGVEYATNVFQPALSITPGEHWFARLRTPEGLTFVNSKYSDASGDSLLCFLKVQHCYEADNFDDAELRSAPKTAEEMITWFRKRKGLEVLGEYEDEVGKVQAKKLRVAVNPHNVSQYHANLPKEGVSLFLLNKDTKSQRGFALGRGELCEVIILSVQDTAVVIVISSPVRRFTHYEPRAREVLSTLAWANGGQPSEQARNQTSVP